jgi:hypothetical protein
MRRYRAEIIDRDGHLESAVYLETHDEEVAAEFAKRRVTDGCNVELWDGKRKIATFKSGE